MRNKPNLHRAHDQDTPLVHYSIIPPFQSDANRAKRSQFRPAGGPTWRSIVRNEANLPTGRPARDTIMRNKANLPRTGRNEGGSARPGGAPPPPSVRNEANFSQQAGLAWGQSCKTNPISPSRRGRRGVKRAKRTQFAHTGWKGCQPAGVGSAASGGDKHAKRTQFLRRDMETKCFVGKEL
jgi:hypothetical protein